MHKPSVQSFFDESTNTFSYVVTCPLTKACAIIDSVLDYDAASATTSTYHADQIIQYIKHHKLKVEWILETHVHADHLSAAQYLKEVLGGKVAMSNKISQVQHVFAEIYHLDIGDEDNNHHFDYLFKDGEAFNIGELKAYNIPTPGHTPACLSYVVNDYCVFIGDTLFMPDYGTARCDFPKGSASVLYDSIQKLYTLHDDMKVFVCHDYLPESRTEFCCKTSIAAQKHSNIHVKADTPKYDFIQMREARDAHLSMPKLILPAIQINMFAGKFPKPESNGVRYLKLPLDYFIKT